MTLDSALRTALENETRLRDRYALSADNIRHLETLALFIALAHEKQLRLDYLEQRMTELKKGGAVSDAGPGTVHPLSLCPAGESRAFLKKALADERKALSFCREAAAGLERTRGRVFKSLEETGAGHVAFLERIVESVQ